jgi:asparagine synthase (glutamine-hydrolysing)
VSAIFGIFRLDGKAVSRDEVASMSERLAHRGSDGCGLWTRGAAGLGHRMLHTTPESIGERQPWELPDAGLVVAADARIDNRSELISALNGSVRVAGAAPTDSQLILAAYQRWGEECANRLLGDFAFAIWDGRDQSLFCARDPMGVKPFYYYRSDRLFVFASEIKGLLSLPEVPRRLNELQLACYLEARLDDTEMTFYEGILRLPAATHLRVRPAGVRATGYWTLDAIPEFRLRGDREYADAFREIFTEAVKCRVRSAFPVGSTLSGGLDSSSIACTARAVLAPQRAPPLHTFSAVFPNLPEDERRVADESRYIDTVVASGGFVPHRIEADRLTPLQDLPEVLWHQDEAPVGYNLYMHWALYGEAEKAGVRVFLDGFDGDACVGFGLDRLAQMAREDQWAELESEIRALCETYRETGARPELFARKHAALHLDESAKRWRWGIWRRAARELARRFGIPWRELLIRHALRPLVPEPVLRAWQRLRGHDPQPSLVSPHFARRLHLVERGAALDRRTKRPPASHTEAHWRGVRSPLYQYVLEMADKAAARFRLEPRYPFFDRRLIEFCVALPLEQRLSHGWTRVILRRAMAGALPPEVQWRAVKQDLLPNFSRGLRGSDRALVERAVARPSPQLGNYVNWPALGEAYHRFAAGRRISGQDDAGAMYRAAVLTHWLGGGDWERPLVLRGAGAP